MCGGRSRRASEAGDTRIETIARALATSARSLQRRLAVAGVSYRQLLDLARNEAAERYLRNRGSRSGLKT
jgi:AraC-like DNA-binding protein